MDTLNQTPETQPQTENNFEPNQAPNNPEFAQKGPLVNNRMKRNIALGCGIFALLVAVILAGVFAYQQLTKPPELTVEPPPPNIVEPEVVISDTPRFAYVKNEKNIWISNINGEEKFSILELPLTSSSVIMALAWKDNDNLSYSTCDTSSRVCEISTYNFGTRSIKPELVASGALITKLAWSDDQKYLAYIENRSKKTNLRLKLGTVDTILKTLDEGEDPSFSKTSVSFSPNSQYILYSTPHDIVTETRGREESRTPTQSLFVYQLNGAQIDEVKNVVYPFFIDDDTVAYRSGNRLVYKDVGTTDESAITDFAGYNPALSSNERQIAYWRDEVGFNNVVLGVYELDKGIHRNILRGVILPVWVSADKLVGIKADSCIGERCLLYEFQTTSMVIVDVNNGEVISVDQGKTLSGVAFYAN